MDSLAAQKADELHQQIVAVFGTINTERDVQVVTTALAQAGGRAMVRAFGIGATDPGLIQILVDQMRQCAENYLATGVERQTTPVEQCVDLTEASPFLDGGLIRCGVCENPHYLVLGDVDAEGNGTIKGHKCTACGEMLEGG